MTVLLILFFFFQAEDGIRDIGVTGVQTCALPISCGMISLSTKLLTVDRISCWMSVRSAVCAKRVNERSSRDSGVRVTGEYGPRARVVPRVPGHPGGPLGR